MFVTSNLKCLKTKNKCIGDLSKLAFQTFSCDNKILRKKSIISPAHQKESPIVLKSP